MKSRIAYIVLAISIVVLGFSIVEANEGVEVGSQISYSVEGVDFHMRLAPASVFPMSIHNIRREVEDNFWIAETLVTYELWYTVRIWALNNGYVFDHEGMEGSNGYVGTHPSNRKNEPVTHVGWYDCIVWTNALSEVLGYEPVYTYDGVVLRDATDTDLLNNAVEEGTKGFRLPTGEEWELAARYQGSDDSYRAIQFPEDSGNYWTPGTYASGATADHTDEAATGEVAWWADNSDVDDTGRKTHDVGLKKPNYLGLYDMSGNVFEWCFTGTETHRERRGGNFTAFNSEMLKIGDSSRMMVEHSSHHYGLRVVRTQ